MCCTHSKVWKTLIPSVLKIMLNWKCPQHFIRILLLFLLFVYLVDTWIKPNVAFCLGCKISYEVFTRYQSLLCWLTKVWSPWDDKLLSFFIMVVAQTTISPHQVLPLCWKRSCLLETYQIGTLNYHTYGTKYIVCCEATHYAILLKLSHVESISKPLSIYCDNFAMVCFS